MQIKDHAITMNLTLIGTLITTFVKLIPETFQNLPKAHFFPKYYYQITNCLYQTTDC